MTTLKAWVHALRLRTLPLSISGILVGSFTAMNNGFWNTQVFVLAIFTTLLFQILSNLANDLGDHVKGADNEDRIGPKRSVQSGLISSTAMKYAVFITAILSFVSALALIIKGVEHANEWMLYFYIGLACCCILAAITYTIGKKAYGYLGLGDIFVFLFFGLVSVLGVYPLFAKTLNPILLLPAASIGLFSAAVLNLNNMRDYENDAAVGKNTLVVKIGFETAKVYHFSLITVGILLWLLFLIFQSNYLGLISLIPGIILIKHLSFVRKNSSPKALDPELKKVALSTFFITFLFAVSVITQQWLF